MKSLQPFPLRPASVNHWIKWPSFLFLLALVCCRVASGADAYYINNAIVSYPGTAAYPPVIDATNFVNNNSFTVNFTVDSIQSEFYETWDTFNYTNIGSLVVNSGFNFDTQSSGSGLRSMAGSFFNPGTISCGSINNASDPIPGLFAALGYDQCLVNASNIINSGLVDVGVDGLIQFTGKNVDLTRCSLFLEGSGANAFGSGIATLLNTNLWDPSLNLGANYADSCFLHLAPFFLILTNSTAYVNVTQGVSNAVVRAVFIQDTSAGIGSVVTNNVFFGTSGIIGPGSVTIQWTGSYLDPASGNTYNNYLYLNDDYLLGVDTNNAINGNGYPDNFTFYASPEPLFLGAPAQAGFQNIFSIGGITNLFSFANVQFVSTTVPTNSIANGALTNLPGRIQISAANELNLLNAEVTGPNYMSFRSTNQFDGSAGAAIQSPFSDINVGVTNGFLTVTNIISAQVPDWGGTVQAWTTRWFAPDPNTGLTNDYRVLIVSSQLSPTISAQVQDLILHGTNSLVISDTLNVIRTFTTDAQSLTLTTNSSGNGATSLDGELNLESPAIFWQTSTPNLRFLTNNGAIRMQNLAYFSFPVLTNVTSPIPATGILSETGTNVVKGDKVTIGAKQYTFVANLTNSVANQILVVPSSYDASLSNLIAAINGAGGGGTMYSTSTTSNSSATAGVLMGHAFMVTARTNGVSGNTITTTFTPATSSVNLSWGGHTTLYGGANSSTNQVSFIGNTAFINNGIFFDQGSILYAGNFESSGVFSNGIGSFNLQSLTTTLTNGAFYASGDVSITANDFVASNVVFQAGRSLTLSITNNLTDTGPSPTNGNFWAVGTNSIGSGINIPIKPQNSSLLGTMITLVAPTNRNVVNVWSGTDCGISASGYSNNLAIGRLIMDTKSSQIPGHNGTLIFNGAGVSNALYVDELELEDYSTTGNATNSYNFPWLQINTNMMIYYAQAVESGVSVAAAIDYAGKHGANGGRLRWIYSYTGYYSSTNLVYTNADGSIYTNVANAGLVATSLIDSDSDGLPNSIDPTPFFMPSEVKFTVTLTNLPPKSAKVQWTTIPNATNFIYYSTNLLATNNWLALTNFKNWYYGNNVAVTNATHGNSFHSPQTYINNASLPDNSQQTNVWIYDAITNVPHYYKVIIWPWLNFGE